MKIFGTKLGCFLAFNIDGSSSRGAHLMLPKGGQLPETDWKKPILVTSISATQREAVGYLPCFNDSTYMYAFGHDPQASMFIINYMAMLTSGSEYTSGGGSGGGGNLTNIVSEVASKYKENRISQTQEKAKLTLGGSSNVFQGHIIGMSTATKDAERNLQTFQIIMAIPECQPS